MPTVRGWVALVDEVPTVFPSISAARRHGLAWPVLLQSAELRDRFSCVAVLDVPLRQLWTTPSTSDLVVVALSLEGHPYVVCSRRMISQQDSREFAFVVERNGDMIAEGKLTARSAEDAIHKTITERKDLQGNDAILHIAKPTGDESGNTASATWGDLHVRVEATPTR